MSFKEIQKEKTAQIEQILKAYLPRVQGYQEVIMDAMSYSMLAGGKRLRPMLMQETYRMFGGADRVIEPFMAAIEMIHTYSLVHDDLPAMDNDEYRRGRKTTHMVYGEDMGILTGDALLNYAFETAASAFEMAPEKSLLIGKAIRILGQKAGIYGMIGGQVVDVKSSGKKIDGEKLEFIYRLKTGALIEASMMIGAILGGASADDILDVISTTEVLGKPVHSDEKNEKMTYVVWKGLDAAKQEVEHLSRKAISDVRALNPKDDYLEILLESLIYREK